MEHMITARIKQDQGLMCVSNVTPAAAADAEIELMCLSRDERGLWSPRRGWVWVWAAEEGARKVSG